VRNPFSREAVARVEVVVPAGWIVPAAQEVSLEAGAEAPLRFELVTGKPQRRARIAADVTVDGIPFGQQAEALVDVL
jgi:hypothetical protein